VCYVGGVVTAASLDRFRTALGDRARDVARDDLLAAATALVDGAKAALPELDAGDAFLEHAARHLRAGDAPLARAIAELRAGDMLLASACASGDRRAIAIFLGRYQDDVLRHARRVRAAGVDAEDLAQEFARRVFSGDAPKIAEYSGRGDLRAWIRIVATRLALDIARVKKSSERPTDTTAAAFQEIAAAGDAPDLAYFRRLYQREVRAAIEAGAARLTSEERAALRDHYVGGMSIDDVAAAQGVHRATAARRIQHARDALVASVRTILDERHGLAGRDLVSVMNLVRSQMNITMGRLLG
jgi:RNA polymerase sigma-70 factor (ECF subfamily)